MVRAVSLLCVLVVACGDDAGGDDTPAFAPLTTDGSQFRDADGHTVLLRGVNARVEGVFDVTFDDGRVPLEEIPALTADDCALMRELGLNLLRLPINWSGIEPAPGQYDEAYLSRVDAAIDCAANAGLFVLVDLHQDAYSKEIGEDGAPLWAIVPAPAMLLEGPLDDLQDRRLSEQVALAFESFFDPTDEAGLQAEFVAMLEVVGARWADHPAVVGFELFNEPDVGADVLDPFHERAAAALREVAPRKLVFFEPPVVRNFLDFQPLAAAPFPTSGGVYAPHIYTYVFGNGGDDLANLDRDQLFASVDNARAEADAWGTPLFIGEFGIGPDTTNADLWMNLQGEIHDELLASNAFWVWKEVSQDRWGLFDEGPDGFALRPQVVAWISRVHPERIAGEVTSLRYDSEQRTMTLVTAGTGGDVHQIYVPREAADTFFATCDGAAATAPRDPSTGLVALACDGALVVGEAQ